MSSGIFQEDYFYKDYPSSLDNRDLSTLHPVCPNSACKTFDSPGGEEVSPQMIMIDVVCQDHRDIHPGDRVNLPEPIWQCPKCKKTYKGRTYEMQNLIQASTNGAIQCNRYYDSSASQSQADMDVADLKNRVSNLEGNTTADVDGIKTTQGTIEYGMELLKDQVRGLRKLVEDLLADPVAFRKNQILKFKLKY